MLTLSAPLDDVLVHPVPVVGCAQLLVGATRPEMCCVVSDLEQPLSEYHWNDDDDDDDDDNE